MRFSIDMKRLHQGCGESLQSNLPGIPLLRRVPAGDVSPGLHRSSVKTRLHQRNRQNEIDHR
jgi:hypothetical protein